jgi:hypothetical protein
VIESFYNKYYWNYSADIRAKWDQAFIKWAETCTGKQITSAIIRMIPIIKSKLPHISSANEILPELRWFALNPEERSISEFKKLQKACAPSDLVKLLTLDMTDWPAGQVQILKLYGSLFSDSSDPQTQELYSAFLQRHSEQPLSNKSSLAEEAPVQSVPASEPENLVQLAPVSSETVSPALEEEHSAQENTSLPVSEASPAQERAAIPPAEMPRDGLALAEALLQWVCEQKSKASAQELRLADLRAEHQKACMQISALREEAADLRQKLANLSKEKLTLEKELDQRNRDIEKLQVDLTESNETIRRIQQMSDNSIKQTLDGFKAGLARSLAQDVEDFRHEYSEKDKAEIYPVLLEDMIDILKRNGISVEEN